MGFYQRKGIDYDQYVFMQGQKFRDEKERQKIANHEHKRRLLFIDYFGRAKEYLRPGSLLCLGARTGCEVQVAKEMGFNPCIGIDLFPIGAEVIKADWHNIPFADDSFDNAYTNSIDHCYDVEVLADEIKRVVRPEGRFYFQLERKKEVRRMRKPRKYINRHDKDFLFWDKGIDLANALVGFGFGFVEMWQDKRWDNFVLQVANEK